MQVEKGAPKVVSGLFVFVHVMFFLSVYFVCFLKFTVQISSYEPKWWLVCFLWRWNSSQMLFLYNKYPECLNFFIAVFIYWDLRIKFCQ